MGNSLYFLRHAETMMNLNQPVREWDLTEAGKKSTTELATSNAFKKLDGIIHSSEKKARQTADIFAKELTLDSYELPELDELRREHTNTLSADEYRERVRLTLSDWKMIATDWETGEDALQRFQEGVRRIDMMFYNKDVLVVSHGLVLTLYFCSLTNFQRIAYERWNQLKFLSWGLVRDGKVLIDIV